MKLTLDGVSVKVGGRALLDGVSLSLATGELVALLGKNGAGKSTLLKAALGLVAASRGQILVSEAPDAATDAATDGAPAARLISKLSGRERAARLAWLPQHFPLQEAFTSVELVATARFRFDEPHAASLHAARAALARTGATELEERTVSTLSGGERQRVAIAVALAQEAPLLLMDEPANHLDPAQQLAMYRLIGELWRAGHGILCVTHDPNLLHHVLAAGEADRVRVIGMDEGRLAFERTLDDAALPEALSRLFGLRVARVVHEGVPFFATLPSLPPPSPSSPPSSLPSLPSLPSPSPPPMTSEPSTSEPS